VPLVERVFKRRKSTDSVLPRQVMSGMCGFWFRHSGSEWLQFWRSRLCDAAVEKRKDSVLLMMYVAS